MRRIPSGRLLWVYLALFGFAGILLWQLFSVQIIQGQAYSDRADRQYVQPNRNLYDRGSIFFTDKTGKVPDLSAATLRSGFIVAITPDRLKDLPATYERINTLVPIDRDSFFLRAGKTGDPYEEIARQVDEKTALELEALEIPGVNVYRERWRYYPGGDLASRTIGLVAYDNDELTGRYGLERYYNDILDRRGTDLYVNFFADIFTNISDTFFSESPRRTGHVITSIEPTVQLFLENKTDEIQGTWNSRQTAAIIMNPATGAIYAMAVTPGFDPNNLSEVADPSVFSNPLVEDVFEMGSIIKPLTMAAALDAGAVRASTTYTDAGTVTLNGRRISNYDGRGRGSVTMQEVLNQSLNTGVVFAVTKMGNKTFADYMRSYGLGEETGIDLPSEGVGLIDNLESPRDIEYATASFGQGIAMTPIATVRALSVLANGGTLVTPHVARKIKLESGRTYDVDYPDGKRVLTEATSEEITRMLVEVVDEALMGGTVKRDHYSIAAKTGTAQIANPQGGGYYEDRYLHSFFGYFPAYDPQFLIFFYTLEPKGVSYASHTLTNPFMDTIDFLINYYGIAPDR